MDTEGTYQHIERFGDKQMLITSYADGSEEINFFYLVNGMPFCITYLSNNDDNFGSVDNAELVRAFPTNITLPTSQYDIKMTREQFITYCSKFNQ